MERQRDAILTRNMPYIKKYISTRNVNNTIHSDFRHNDMFLKLVEYLHEVKNFTQIENYTICKNINMLKYYIEEVKVCNMDVYEFVYVSSEYGYLNSVKYLTTINIDISRVYSIINVDCLDVIRYYINTTYITLNKILEEASQQPWGNIEYCKEFAIAFNYNNEQYALEYDLQI